jgi:hypothetical protein
LTVGSRPGVLWETVKLLRYQKPVATIFDLLGTKEDDMTYSLGYVVSRSPHFAAALLKVIVGRDLQAHQEGVVRLQTIAKEEKGRTDIEIKVGEEVFVVIEAKRGPWLPSEKQLRRYLPVVCREKAKERRLVAVTNATEDYARMALPAQLDGVPVVHIAWRRLRRLAEEARSQETNRNKHLLDEFAEYLREIVTMENVRSNMALVLVLNRNGAWGLSFKDVVYQHHRYFDPVERHRHGTPNYLAFRYDSRLQSIHHVDRVEIFTNPRDVFPTAQNASIKPHYLFHLGPAIRPAHAVKNGPKVVRNGRRYCMIDTLLTCATITEAYLETKRRLDGEDAGGETEEDENDENSDTSLEDEDSPGTPALRELKRNRTLASLRGVGVAHPQAQFAPLVSHFDRHQRHLGDPPGQRVPDVHPRQFHERHHALNGDLSRGYEFSRNFEQARTARAAAPASSPRSCSRDGQKRRREVV